MAENTEGSSGEELKLPFDPRTVARAVWRRRYLMLLIVLLSGLLGAGVGLVLGKRTYQSETVLHYRASGGTERREVETSLLSLVNQVKVLPNIVEVRERLHLPVMLETLAAAIEVEVPEETSLMVIRAQSDSPEQAAAIANTTREVFLERWFRSLQSSLETIYERTLIEKRTSDLQAGNLQQVLAELQRRAEREARITGQRLSDTMRYQWLRDSLGDDERTRANRAELAAREAEAEQAHDLYKKGLLPESDLEKAMTALEKQKLITIDPEPTSQIKDKIRELGGKLAKAGEEPKGGGVEEMMTKASDLEISRIAINEKLATLEAARKLLRERLEMIEQLRAPGRPVDHQAIAAEMRTVQGVLSRVRGLYDNEATEFLLVSEANAPISPLRSTRRFLALAVGAILSVLGVAAVVSREMLTGRIRSSDELSLKLSLPVLGVVPLLEVPDPRDPAMREAVATMAQALRRSHPGAAAVLVTGAQTRAGTTTISAGLAAALGRQHERVLLVDFGLRDAVRPEWMEALLKNPKGPGLGTLLSTPGMSPEAVVHPTTLPGVDCIPFDGVAAGSDLLAAPTFGHALAALQQKYGVIIMDAPPALQHSDACLIARWGRTAVVVARGGSSKASRIRKTVERLQAAGAQVAGVVLNCADPYFQH